MKFLILGSSGMAGHVISIYLKEQGHEVTGFCRRHCSYINFVHGDVRDLKHVKNIIDAGQYDAIINAVGILNQFAESDSEAAVFLNSYLPHYLSKITLNTKTQIIQISTDCVFSGTSGPYTETSFCDGTTTYDRTKALGKLRDNKNLTLRQSIIGPDLSPNGIGLLNWFMQQSEINGYTNAIWTGVTSLQLGKIIEAAVIKKIHGLIHMVPNTNISKYDLLQLLNHHLLHDTVIIHPYDEFKSDKTLIRTNHNFDYTVPDYETMIIELSEWMNVHKALYPHYSLG
ncbi:MAG: sugar nucleotide-binding protein [Clostridium sp.]|nr:sugar nucleotide-binding protein [Clostridium sp.]